MAYDSIQLDDRLILRPPIYEDALAVLDIIARDSAYLGQYLPWAETVPSLEDQTRYIQSRMNDESESDGRRAGKQSEWYAIQLDDELVGAIELTVTNDTGRKGELGYWLASHSQGRGIMTRSAIALTSLGFAELRLNVIWIHAELSNTPSRSVAERAGYAFRGKFSPNMLMRQDPVIMAGYSADADEWELPD